MATPTTEQSLLDAIDFVRQQTLPNTVSNENIADILDGIHNLSKKKRIIIELTQSGTSNPTVVEKLNNTGINLGTFSRLMAGRYGTYNTGTPSFIIGNTITTATIMSINTNSAINVSAEVTNMGGAWGLGIITYDSNGTQKEFNGKALIQVEFI